MCLGPLVVGQALAQWGRQDHKALKATQETKVRRASKVRKESRGLKAFKAPQGLKAIPEILGQPDQLALPARQGRKVTLGLQALTVLQGLLA